ncbi:MAG TPA: PhzF family phenazine biosynthesis protein [Acidimicrobiales bacterium]
MVELPYRIVDVFTDRPLAGNALCVVLAPAPEAIMPAIAREVNLSETTFVTQTGDSSYDVRIFTPTAELPFAGHPTLGTAWALGPGTWTQRSPGATVTVEVDERGGTMSQPDPTVTEVYPEDAARGLGLPPANARHAFVVEVGGTRHVLVATDHPLERLRFEHAALATAARAVGATGVGAMRLVGEAEVHVRLVVPGESSTFEDPGTGSAAGPVGMLARRLWGVGPDVRVRQGDEIGRPCRIDVHAEAGAVRVGGAVTACAEGVFRL